MRINLLKVLKVRNILYKLEAILVYSAQMHCFGRNWSQMEGLSNRFKSFSASNEIENALLESAEEFAEKEVSEGQRSPEHFLTIIGNEMHPW